MKKIAKFLASAFIFFSIAYLSLFIVDLGLYFLSLEKNQSLVESPEPYLGDQFLHPYYFFFFTDKEHQLQEINSWGHEFPWFDKRGFGGGLGPEMKGDRELAFILGGSTAFGWAASQYNKAIPHILNKIQSKYFFVGAGVPSWNSYQEFLRLSKEIIKYKPSLVISLTGYNDIINSYRRRNLSIPLDSPESYEELYDWVENIRKQDFRNQALKKYFYNSTPLGSLLLFQIRKRFFKTNKNETKFESAKGKPVEFESYEGFDLKNSAKILSGQIRDNLDLMYNLSKAFQIKYVAILQPMQDIHPQIFSKKSAQPSEYNLYYDKVIKQVKNNDQNYILNWTTLFKDLKIEDMNTLFSDECHFTDKGYEVMANKINNLILKK